MEKIYKVYDLLREVNKYYRTFFNFFSVFNINYRIFMLDQENSSFYGTSKIHKNLYDYFVRNKNFIDNFYSDWHRKKTIRQMSEDFNLDLDILVKLFQDQRIFNNYGLGGPHCHPETLVRYCSSYQACELIFEKKVIERPEIPLHINPTLSNDLTSDQFILTPSPTPLPTQKLDNLKSKNSIVGYDDIKTFILDQISSLKDDSLDSLWGLCNPGGIILYGPPGCGKTLWANWIAEYLNYELVEIPRSMFGSSYVDGAMKNLVNILEEIKTRKNIVLFFDEFDSIASSRKEGTGASNDESKKVVNTLLQQIPKLIEKKIVIIAATNFINSLDPAVTRPGRFDLKLPIFPPLPNERINLLSTAILSDSKLNKLEPISPLIEILTKNGMVDLSFWQNFSHDLSLFSNSQIIDLAKTIKSKIKKSYEEQNFNIDLIIPYELVSNSIKESKFKMTKLELETLIEFIKENKKQAIELFQERVNSLESELNQHGSFKTNPIGFKRN